MNDLLTARPRVLVVDDEPMSRTLMDAVLRTGNRYEVIGASGAEGLDMARQQHPDLLVLDIGGCRMEHSLDVCRALKTETRTRRIPIMMVMPAAEADRTPLLEAGADDVLSKPFNRVELLARVRSLLRIKSLNDQLDEVEDVIYALGRIIEAREGNDYEARTERVVLYATALGREAGLSEDALRIISQAAVLRDLGKIGVPDRLLGKRGSLSQQEQKQMQGHAALGEQIIAPLRSTAALLPIVRHHHERIDGTGYPDGLTGEQIPLGARIVAIADAYDAMISARPYRPAMPPQKAFATLQAGAGKQWDARLVQAFIRWMQSQPHMTYGLK